MTLNRSFGAFSLPLFLLALSLNSCGQKEVKVESAKSTVDPTTSPTATFPERVRANYDAKGANYMIATQGEATTRAARKIFDEGGNVFDAAAAASFALAVERPQSTGIGGGGFMLIYQAKTGKAVAVDFREMAPAKAAEKMYQDAKGEVIKDASTEGVKAVAVPGMVAGVLSVHQKYGKLSRAVVMQPAIDLAEKGFPVYPHMAAALKARSAALWKNTEARSVFFKGETPLELGDTLKQTALAKTLRAIAKNGKNGFYRGWVAEAFLKEQKTQGGLISKADLDHYAVKYREPVHGDYKGFEVISMPPPSSGGVHVVEILNVVEGFPLDKEGAYSVPAVHQTVSAMQLAYFDRAKYMGDSDFVKIPLQGLTSEAYAAKLHASIGDRAKKFTEVAPPSPESKETTHFTIADRAGNVISSTQTINGWFGSGVVVPKAGFVMNNEMDDFSSKPGVPNKFGVIGGKENAIEPGKRPLSSMSPTIVLDKKKPVIALGSPAGSQIITCVSLTLLNYLTYKMPLYDSVTALRYHHQWTPDKIVVEAPGFSAPLTQGLQNLGYEVEKSDIGCKIEAVAFENNELHGVSDPRGEGYALGDAVLEPTKVVPNKKDQTVSPD